MTKNIKKCRHEARKNTIKEYGYSSDDKKVIWCFDMIDKDGKYAFNLDRKDFLHKIFLDKMIGYSSMTWDEIKRQTHDKGKSKNHFVSFDKLSKEAVQRCAIKHLEEYTDSLFSFALTNKLRIVGIRKNEYFHVLWYDPAHEICPSTLKHS